MISSNRFKEAWPGPGRRMGLFALALASGGSVHYKALGRAALPPAAAILVRDNHA